MKFIDRYELIAYVDAEIEQLLIEQHESCNCYETGYDNTPECNSSKYDDDIEGLVELKNKIIYLTDADFNTFVEELNNPPEPNDKLKEAAERCKLGL